MKNKGIRFPARRIYISKNDYVGNNFLIELTIAAKIYEPENLLDEVKEDRFVGYIICKDCIVEALTQEER
jgi:hypothetical protein